MKILLVNKFYYLKGGAEKYFFDLKKMLEEKGQSVVSFSMQNERNFDSPQNEYFVNNVDIGKPRVSLRAAARILYSFEAKKKLEKLIKKEKPDIAHLHNIYHQISPSILTVLKKHKIPIIMTLHDFKILCPVYILYTHGEICERCKTYHYWQCTLRRCAKNSYLASELNTCEMFLHKFLKIYEKNVDLFVTPSEFLKNKILEWRRLPKEKIRVLPHFVDDALKCVTPISPSGVTSFSLSQNYILYFGRLSHEKGVDILLKAIKILKQSKINNSPIFYDRRKEVIAKFFIAGSGPKEKELKDFAAKNNLQNEVRFLGYLRGKDLQNAIKNSLFTVMPSRVYESFGMAALESFNLGKPVLAANLGALPELVKDGESGMLFKVADAHDLAKKIAAMLENRSKITAMGQNAKKLAQEKYGKELHWQKLEKIYQEFFS